MALFVTDMFKQVHTQVDSKQQGVSAAFPCQLYQDIYRLTSHEAVFVRFETIHAILDFDMFSKGLDNLGCFHILVEKGRGGGGVSHDCLALLLLMHQ